jgi:hypothetical protein
MAKEVIFLFSRTKAIFSFIGVTFFSLLFLTLAILSLFYGNDLGVIVGTFFFFILFLAWIDGLVFLRKSLNGLPALELTPTALIDNTNDIEFSWKDIEGFEEMKAYFGKGMTKKYIAISLYDEAKYLLLVRSWKKQLLAKINGRFFGGTFSIETNAINEKRDIVLETLRKFKDNFSA